MNGKMKSMDVIGLGTSALDCRGNTHIGSHWACRGAPNKGVGSKPGPEVPGRRRQAVRGDMNLESLLKVLGCSRHGLWGGFIVPPPYSSVGPWVAGAFRHIRSEQSSPSQPSTWDL